MTERHWVLQAKVNNAWVTYHCMFATKKKANEQFKIAKSAAKLKPLACVKLRVVELVIKAKKLGKGQ